MTALKRWWRTRFPSTNYGASCVTTRYTGSSKVPATFHPHQEIQP